MKTLHHIPTPAPHKHALRLASKLAIMVAFAFGMTLFMGVAPNEAAAQSPVIKTKKKTKKKVVTKKKKKKKKKVTSKRVVNTKPGSKRVLKKRTVRPVRKRTRRTTVRHHSTPRHTTVHHYHDGGRQGAATRTTTRSKPSSSPYLTLGVGAVGTNAATTAEESTTGLSFGLGLRASENLAVEIGLLGILEETPANTSADANNQDLVFGGISADAKVILPVGPIEPYGLIGAGLYTFDSSSDESLKPAVNFGVGADFKIAKNIGIGGRYVYHGFWFDETSGVVASDQLESAWSGVGTLSVSF